MSFRLVPQLVEDQYLLTNPRALQSADSIYTPIDSRSPPTLDGSHIDLSTVEQEKKNDSTVAAKTSTPEKYAEQAKLYLKRQAPHPGLPPPSNKTRPSNIASSKRVKISQNAEEDEKVDEQEEQVDATTMDYQDDPNDPDEYGYNVYNTKDEDSTGAIIPMIQPPFEDEKYTLHTLDDGDDSYLDEFNRINSAMNKGNKGDLAEIGSAFGEQFAIAGHGLSDFGGVLNDVGLDSIGTEIQFAGNLLYSGSRTLDDLVRGRTSIEDVGKAIGNKVVGSLNDGISLLNAGLEVGKNTAESVIHGKISIEDVNKVLSSPFSPTAPFMSVASTVGDLVNGRTSFDQIGHSLEETGHKIGHALEDAGHKIGDFFSSLFH
jgi:hypothetical protein